MVRTLTHEDVNVIDGESLAEAGVLDNQVRSRKDFEGMTVMPAVLANREPIYKLTWAGFPDQAALKALATQPDTYPVTNATAEYGERGETLLLVLGGQSPGEKPGINMLQFPSYQPPVPSAKTVRSAISEGLSLTDRYAYRDSLSPTGLSNYPTKTPPEDFTLLPRNSPYFAMAHDPIAIFVLLTPDSKLPHPMAMAERQLESYAFPPPRSNVPPPVIGRKTFQTPGEGETLVAMTPAPRLGGSTAPPARRGSSWKFPWSASPTGGDASSLGSVTPSIGREGVRRRYRLPSLIWSGGLSVLGCNVIPLPTPTFQRLINHTLHGTESITRVPVRGGMAVPDLQSHGAPDIKVIKMESYRILATWHADCTVRFWDISPHLLCLPTPLRFEYPNPLPHLTISIGEWLRHSDLVHLPIAKLWATDRSKVQIASVHLARESLECVITFVSGEVFVTKFAEAKAESVYEANSVAEEDEDRDPASPRQDYFPVQPAQGHDWVEEITEIQHLAKHTTDGFKPVAVLVVRRGEVVSCAVSDIGFIAVAYAQNSLAILDMRGPDVILREGFTEDGKTMKRRKRKGNAHNFPSENSPVGSMKWVISGMGGDPSPRPRLIVSYDKGTTKIYGLQNIIGEWTVEQKPPTFANESLANPLSTYVLDPETGNERLAAPQALADMVDQGPSNAKWSKEAPPHSLWIAASKHAIRCSVNFNGDRVAKVEFEQEELSDVHYITRHGKRVIVALTTTGSAIFYSAPFLEYITRMDLFFGGTPRQIGRLSFDDRSGDFVEYCGPLDISLRTLFHFRKPFPPRIDPCTLKTPIPPQPTPVNSSYLGWMWGSVLTGTALDSIIAGPNRPAAPKPPAAARKPLISWGAPSDDIRPATAATTTVAPKRKAVTKTRQATGDSRERQDAYGVLSNAMHQRGDYIDRMGESVNDMADTAQNYLNAARDAAFKETAKVGAKGVMGKIL